MRLTVDNVQQILNQNEGFTATTSYSAKNFSETREYRISGGALHIRARGKTSWADSKFDTDQVADIDQTRRFLREHLWELNLVGLD
jgi:hypothetical protein